jgi:hypothetical protein
VSATTPTPAPADYEAVTPFLNLLAGEDVLTALKDYVTARYDTTANAGNSLFAATSELQKALAAAHAGKAKGS